ncbi:MAG: phosphoenolpyruvate carboxylase, partial [Cyanobacteria bacterium P01_A01_bin.17]
MGSIADGSNSDLMMPPRTELLLQHRLTMIEALLEEVLQDECGQDLVDLLQQLRSMCSPEGQAPRVPEAEVLKVVEKLELGEAIRAARAFALYFQLINIAEQHYEQEASIYRTHGSMQEKHVAQASTADSTAASSQTPYTDARGGSAEHIENSLYEMTPPDHNLGTFSWLFPQLKRLNVPTRHIQQLIDALDVKLVFTAHPTEIVRSTIRNKQRRIVSLLSDLDAVEAGLAARTRADWELDAARSLLTEEIRLWWRTDELHQFKPEVLDEVEYGLHYFDEVLFDAIPQLYRRLSQNLQEAFPQLKPPQYDFCKFGSWVGSDRDGNPSVTPEITWQTACYQRDLVLQKYISAVTKLIDLLSLSMHWCDVRPDLLDSLEQDQLLMPEIYDQLAIRFRQEPYRLKLSYILKRLKNTRDRNSQQTQGGDLFAAPLATTLQEPQYYTNVEAF